MRQASQLVRPSGDGSRRVGCAVLAMLVLSAGCRSSDQRPPAPPDPAPLTISLAHLRHLGRTVTVNGRPVRVVSLYAEAPDYAPVGSPARDGYEGIASVDDAARAAVVFLRAWEMTGDSLARSDAEGLLAFVTAMEQGDGEFVNFVDARGRLNLTAPSSRKSMSYWGARAIWALGEGVRVLGPAAFDSLPYARAVLSRAVSRAEREIADGRLIGGSATATSELLLGLVALHRREPSPAIADLAARTAALLVPLSPEGTTTAPWGGRVDRAREDWHAWGTRSVEALALAAVELQRPDLATAARREADELWGRFMMAGQVPALVSSGGTVTWYPQIAYGIGPIVEGYLALASATGESRYAALAGLSATWFLGANVASVAMYDSASGRTFDGIDAPVDGQTAATINRNSGAESTIEALLALQQVARDPEALAYVRYHPVAAAGTRVDSPPAARRWTGPNGAAVTITRGASGLSMSLADSVPTIRLTYWPAANPTEVEVATVLVAQWNAANPGIQVTMQPLPAGRSSEEVLLAAIVARATPDVSSNVSSALLARLVRAGGVVRLDDRAATSARLLERTSPAMRAPLQLPDGGIYAFPWKTNPAMLMYNVDLLQAAHVAPPRTQDEMLDAFRRLARDTDDDGRADRWPFWATLKTTWFERFYDFYPLYLANSRGVTLVQGDSVVFDNPAAVAAMEMLRRGFADGTLPKSNFALGRDPFADGTVAMKIIGPWFVRELDAIKSPGLRYDVVPVPAMEGTPPGERYAFGDLRSIAVFSTTRHPDAAARFVAFLTSPEADRMLIEAASQLPYRRGLSGDPRFVAALARWPTLATYATFVEHTRDLDIDPDVVEMFDLLSEAYEESAVYGTRPVKSALARAAREAQRLVDAR